MTTLKILFYAAEFAPAGTTGAIRPTKLAKYFSRFGHEIKVISCQPNNTTYADLLPAVEAIEIQRVRIRRILPINDTGLWFLLYSLPRLFRTAREWKPHVIFVSVPHFYPAIAPLLVRIALRTPYVIDYRDLWFGDPYPPISVKDRISRLLGRALEPAINRFSLLTVYISDRMKAEQEAIFGMRKNSAVISTGFDKDDIERSTRSTNADLRQVFTYVGNIDANMQIDSFMKALSAAIRENPEEGARVMFVGRNIERAKQAADAAGVTARCIFRGPVGKTEALDLVRTSRGTIIFGGNHPQRLNRKVFEALAVSNNIFYLGDESTPTAQILRSFGMPHILDQKSETSKISSHLQSFLSSRNSLAEIPRRLEEYSKEALARSYIDKIKEALLLIDRHE